MYFGDFPAMFHGPFGPSHVPSHVQSLLTAQLLPQHRHESIVVVAFPQQELHVRLQCSWYSPLVNTYNIYIYIYIYIKYIYIIYIYTYIIYRYTCIYIYTYKSATINASKMYRSNQTAQGGTNSGLSSSSGCNWWVVNFGWSNWLQKKSRMLKVKLNLRTLCGILVSLHDHNHSSFSRFAWKMLLLPQNLTGLHPGWIHFWIAKLVESFMAKSVLVTDDHKGVPAPLQHLHVSQLRLQEAWARPARGCQRFRCGSIYGSFPSQVRKFSCHRDRILLVEEAKTGLVNLLNLLNPGVYHYHNLPHAGHVWGPSPWTSPRIGTSVLRVSACTGRAVGVACFRSGGFNPINDSQAIINEPYFDNLYHPLMVILGMVYYCFTNIVLVNLLNPSTRCLQWCVHASGKPDGRIASACSARSLSTSS